jgi:sugar phosphate isomerase/epimerase
MRRDQIALQLYTVRELAATDLAGTLRAVASAGYRHVELAALPDIEPARLAHLLGEAGLSPVASHESIEQLRADPDAVADRLATLGCPRVIVPWMAPEHCRRVVDVRRFAATVASVGQRLADRGLRVGYHNHDFEFEPLEGTTIWDVLLAELPAAIDLELDVYWLSVGGRDPVAEIRAAGDRVRLLHMKDRAPGAEPRDAPVGTGILPFAAIVEAGRAAGVEWYVAEQDEPADAIADITTAARNLEALAESGWAPRFPRP